MSSINKVFELRAVAALAAIGALAACGSGEQAASDATPASRISAQAVTAAEAVTGDEMRRVIAEISADSYGGRLPGSEGEAKARTFLAAELAKTGFEPAGPDGSYEQTMELVGVTTNAPAAWRFEQQGGAVELARGTDFIAASGLQAPSAGVDNAEVVFAGYGIVAPEYDWNDFKDVDVRGKVLIVLNNDPDWDPALFDGVTRLYYGRWMYKYESAARQGAAGVIIVHTTPSAG